MLKMFFTSVLLFLTFCTDRVANNYAPSVTPEIIETGTDFVMLKWNSAGDTYFYSVAISSDTIPDNDFRGCDTIYSNISDTFFTVHNLSQNTYYKIQVITTGQNIANTNSWPPIRFKTK